MSWNRVALKCFVGHGNGPNDVGTLFYWGDVGESSWLNAVPVPVPVPVRCDGSLCDPFPSLPVLSLVSRMAAAGRSDRREQFEGRCWSFVAVLVALVLSPLLLEEEGGCMESSGGRGRGRRLIHMCSLTTSDIAIIHSQRFVCASYYLSSYSNATCSSH